MNTSDNPADNGAVDGDLIRPVGYERPTASSRKSLTLSPVKALLTILAAVAVGVLWFLFSARSVQVVFDPSADDVVIDRGMSLALSDVFLMFPGDYQLTANAMGYYPLEVVLNVGEDRNQRHEFAFAPLPGVVDIVTDPEGVSVSANGVVLGETPLYEVDLEAGDQHLRFEHPRYQPANASIFIEGRRQKQAHTQTMRPNWGDISLASVPAGAEILVDDEPTGLTTPAAAPVLAGEHEIRLKLAGHKSFRKRILVVAEQAEDLGAIALTKADGLLTVTTIPTEAGVTLNGQYKGISPIEIDMESGRNYRLQVFKAGFAPAQRTVSLKPGEELKISMSLNQNRGDLVVLTDPPDAQLFVNGQSRGNANQTVRLPTTPHNIEIRLDGYAGYKTTIVPKEGLTQEVKVRLLTIAEARLAALKPVIQTSQGQNMRLLEPSSVTMGASRREPGRRANETLREVALTRLFYLATTEVTNAQFKEFATGHDSGKYEEYQLSKDDMPASMVSWNDAALYCNWLSKREDRDPFYRTEFSKVVGINSGSTGYRLPTEAEWAWTARYIDGKEQLRFPWGDNLPPTDRNGNYADHSAAHMVGRIIFGYNDNHIVAAPVGTFPANARGIHDLGGNVAEWVNDFYEIPSADAVTDPLGPDTADFHVIKGSSWMHGTVTDLRLAFRDYGADGRRDVGFRIARFAE
ncbi:MAG: PEGA domain-containing protein [Proteobacteria bacterium]|nr:PEGA domain-containing protein [Pseudomonadota bacterium]